MQVDFTVASQFLCLRKCGFLYTRFLTFMLISTMVFYVVKNNGISVMRDGDEHPTSFVEASQKRRSSKS